MRAAKSVFGLMMTMGLAAGCATTTDEELAGRDESGIMKCPVGGCDLPEPKDPPPPKPPQPDAAKFRTVTIPTVWVKDSVNAALLGTVVQISHMGGDVLSMPGFRRECATNDSPEMKECLDVCAMATPQERAGCKESCNSIHGTCTNTCRASAYSSTSFVKWGPAAKAISELTKCNTTTCPACATPTDVRSLTDMELAVPVYRRDLSIPGGPAWYLNCQYNQWRFAFENLATVRVDISTYGISFRVPGTTGTPAVHCDNGPDVTAEDLELMLTFRFSRTGPPLIVAEGALLGDLSSGAGPVLDYVADLETRAKDKVKEISANRLNKPANVQLYNAMFRKLVDRYLTATNRAPVATMGLIQTDVDGLHVSYWTN